MPDHADQRRCHHRGCHRDAGQLSDLLLQPGSGSFHSLETVGEHPGQFGRKFLSHAPILLQDSPHGVLHLPVFRLQYAAALSDFLSHHSIDKLAATPWRGTGHYTNVDPVMLKFIPKPVTPCSDKFQIYEYYEASSLQTFLKLDFYKA